MLAGAAYLAASFEWLVLLAIALPGFFDSSLGHTIFPQYSALPPSPEPTEATQVPSTFIAGLTIVAGLLLIGLVIYIIVMRYIPTMSRSASKVVHVTAQKAVPVITHKPAEALPARRRKRLTARLVLWIKLTVVVLPVVIFAFVHLARQTLGTQLALLAQSLLALFALGGFLCQLALARQWRVNEADIA